MPTKYQEKAFVMPKRMKSINLTYIGKKYGKITVVSFAGIFHRRAYFKCLCECGNETYMCSSSLTRINSCGCDMPNSLKNKSENHNYLKHPLYRIWVGMRRRCSHPTSMYEKEHYKDKNIKVCDEWQDNFVSFYNWSMANGWKDERYASGYPKFTIDRIDNDKGYSPDNCRWVDMSTQLKNRGKMKYRGTANSKILRKQYIHYKNSFEINERQN